MSLVNAFPQKYTGGGGSGLDYSLTEQDTGIKWIDGKPIYQKTINFGTMPNKARKTVAHNITNLGEIIDYKVTCVNTSNYTSWQSPIPVGAWEGDNRLVFYVEEGLLNITTTADWDDWIVRVTLQYTKTT